MDWDSPIDSTQEPDAIYGIEFPPAYDPPDEPEMEQPEPGGWWFPIGKGPDSDIAKIRDIVERTETGIRFPNLLAIWYALCSAATDSGNKTFTFKIADGTLAYRAGVSRKTIRRCKPLLKRAGLARSSSQRPFRHLNPVTTWRIFPKAPIFHSQKSNVSGGTCSPHPCGQEVHTPVVRKSHVLYNTQMRRSTPAANTKKQDGGKDSEKAGSTLRSPRFSSPPDTTRERPEDLNYETYTPKWTGKALPVSYVRKWARMLGYGTDVKQLEIRIINDLETGVIYQD